MVRAVFVTSGIAESVDFVLSLLCARALTRWTVEGAPLEQWKFMKWVSARQRRSTQPAAEASIHRFPSIRPMAVIVVAATAAAVIAVTFAVTALAFFYEPPKTFERKHLSNARAAVTDAEKELVGAAPSFVTGEKATAAAMTDEEARMAAIVVNDVPPVWWDVVVALEDRRFGRFGWLYGVDLVALPQVFFGRGASTLPMQLVGNLSGAKVEQRTHGGALLWKLKRKLKEIASTPALVRATSADDYLWLKRLIATHLPVMHGQIGGSTVGIAGATWILWGKTLNEVTTPGRQAILAGALQKNILYKKVADHAVKARWAYIKNRAKRGLVLAYGANDPRTTEGVVEIDAMPDVPPLFLSDDLPLPARAHVVHRRNFTARTVIVEAQAQLVHRFGRSSLSQLPPQGYELTLSSLANFRFKQKLDLLADSITERVGRECRLFVPLGGGFADATYERVTAKPNCAPPDLPKTERAQVLAVLANASGEIVRFYQTGSEEAVYAGSAGRSANEGRYDATSEMRDVGSIAKLAVALLLASEGDSPEQRYCRHAFDGRLDSDGTTGFVSCSAPGAMITAAEAFARSSNLAILWRLRQVPKERIRQLAADLGLGLPGDVDPAVAFAFGQVRAAPSRVHMLIHHIGRAVFGLSTQSSFPLRVINAVDFGAGLSAFSPKQTMQLRRYIANADQGAYIRAVLEAVIAHPRGTMHFLNAYTSKKNERVSGHIGKTGTPVNAGKFATDKFVTGAVVLDGRYFSYLVLVRAPNPAKYPLGERVSARDFAPLVLALLAEIPASNEQTSAKERLRLTKNEQ